MRRTLLAALIVGASLLTLTVTAAPAAAQSKCTAAQYKAMGKKYLSKLKCYAKAVTQSVPVDAACLQTAEDKFATKWAAAVAKGDCLNAASEEQGENAVDVGVTAAEALLQPPPSTTSTTATTTSSTTSTTVCVPSCPSCVPPNTSDGCGGFCVQNCATGCCGNTCNCQGICCDYGTYLLCQSTPCL